MKPTPRRSQSFIIKGSFIALIVFSATLALIVTSTQPETIGLLEVVGFFLVLYAVLLSLFVLLYALRRHNQQSMPFRSILKMAVLALAPVMLVALSSTSPLGVLDFLLVFGFEVAALFYVGRVS